MKLRVLYFAALRERVGRSEETVDAPEDIATLRNCANGWHGAVSPGRKRSPDTTRARGGRPGDGR